MRMSAVDEVLETELERVERWRTDALERAGYRFDEARAIAIRLDVDLHDAIDLVDRGCPPELAARILL
jgi:hypothetical protein